MHIHRCVHGEPETELPNRFLPRLLKLRQAAFRFKNDEDYDAASLTAELFARPKSGCHTENSLAHSMLGLPELGQEEPLAEDTDRLLAKIAALDRIHPTILKCPHDRSLTRPSTNVTAAGAGGGVIVVDGVGGGVFTPVPRHTDTAAPAAPVATRRQGGTALPAEALFSSPAEQPPTSSDRTPQLPRRPVMPLSALKIRMHC